MRGKTKKHSRPERIRMRQYREAGISIEDCAECFEVSVSTVNRYLRELRKEKGPEKLPKMQSARWHTAVLKEREMSVKNNSEPMNTGAP